MGLKAAVSWVPVLSPVLSLAEAPVRIVGSNEEAPHTYTAGQRVELWCQLSRPAAPVRWYKDGEEVDVGKSLVLEQEGPRHRLVLPCARPQDTGEFVCDAGGDSVFYTITVAGECDAGGLEGSHLKGLSLLVQGATAHVTVACCSGVGDACQRCSCQVLTTAGRAGGVLVAALVRKTTQTD